MPPLRSQLLPFEENDLRELGKLHDLKSSLHDYLARAWDFEGGIGDARSEKLIAGWSAQFPQWNREQVRVALAVNSAQGGMGLVVSTARRILFDDPAELAVGECLAFRLAWLLRRVREQSGEGMAGDDLPFIPCAMAVRDVRLAERMLEPRPPPRDQEAVDALLSRAFAAAVRRSLPELQDVAQQLNAHKIDRCRGWIGKCIAGIAEGSTHRVAEALQEELQNETRARSKKQARNTVCIEAHGFYRLAEWVSPDLVDGFDVTQGLPWDAGFHTWTEANRDPLEGLDLTGISPEFHRAVVDLELPDWFRVLVEPESPWDLCRVILEDLGPDPGAVREILETWCRIRKWEPVDLSPLQHPDRSTRRGVALAEVPRHQAFMMRRLLLEAGAEARFDKVSTPDR